MVLKAESKSKARRDLDIETIAYRLRRPGRKINCRTSTTSSLFGTRAAFVEHQQIGKSRRLLASVHRVQRSAGAVQGLVAARRNTEAHDSKCSIIDFWETGDFRISARVIHPPSSPRENARKRVNEISLRFHTDAAVARRVCVCSVRILGVHLKRMH